VQTENNVTQNNHLNVPGAAAIARCTQCSADYIFPAIMKTDYGPMLRFLLALGLKRKRVFYFRNTAKFLKDLQISTKCHQKTNA
jgi:hypothetical protein